LERIINEHRQTNVVLETRKLSLSFGEQPILRDVSFQIHRGEYVSIVGPNGAGKTTLLKVLDRLIAGGTGDVEICGIAREKWHQKDLAKSVAFVPQADSRVSPFTVEQFLLMCRYPHLSPFASVNMDDRNVVFEAMAKTGTSAFAKRRLDTLSSGERQRVYIASALAQGAHIWLVDEPMTFLDYHYQDEILSLIALANTELDVTIVIVTHDLNRAVLESDRIMALREGRLVFFDSPDRIMEPDVLQRIYGTPLLTVEHPMAGLSMIVPRMTPEKEKDAASRIQSREKTR
jgi:iron complex transport system ATP-binding protein